MNSEKIPYYKGNENNINSLLGSSYIKRKSYSNDKKTLLQNSLPRTKNKNSKSDNCATTSYEGKDVGVFHEERTKVINEQKTRLTVIIGNLNTKLEEQQNQEETQMAPFSYRK